MQFDVDADPSEYNNIAAESSELLVRCADARMQLSATLATHEEAADALEEDILPEPREGQRLVPGGHRTIHGMRGACMRCNLRSLTLASAGWRRTTMVGTFIHCKIR